MPTPPLSPPPIPAHLLRDGADGQPGNTAVDKRTFLISLLRLLAHSDPPQRLLTQRVYDGLVDQFSFLTHFGRHGFYVGYLREASQRADLIRRVLLTADTHLWPDQPWADVYALLRTDALQAFLQARQSFFLEAAACKEIAAAFTQYEALAARFGPLHPLAPIIVVIEPEASVTISDPHGEIVHWVAAEWIVDPAVVTAIANALVIAFTDGAPALQLRVGWAHGGPNAR